MDELKTQEDSNEPHDTIPAPPCFDYPDPEYGAEYDMDFE